MNVVPQYWFILAAFVSLAIAATVALHRSRSLSSILFGCSAWLAMFWISGLMLEPLVANETFVAPDDSITIHYDTTLRTVMDWGLMFSAVLVVAGAAAYVFVPKRQFRSSPDRISSDEAGNHPVQRRSGGS